ncbi:helix-turn-helix domain-containing protein [Chryseobacterium culicis]|uniref:Helix-turn-helix n=1 Tax=Chryseobacterium culicis TaxID=680127 RepID=A0A1H6I0A7_CHRCI|nr:helix-turn-helix transcriptional regulator [Chryseobacterium culicis]SEH39907.1 Helix-turn-helix [Chryseobacterium culicis]
MRNKFLKEIIDQTSKDTEIFIDKYSDIVLRINQILKEKNISQKDLATSMGKSPSELSKWLSGNHNLTLRSIAKIEAELGESIIEIPLKCFTSNFKEEWEQTIVSFVIEKKIKAEKNTNRKNWDESRKIKFA